MDMGKVKTDVGYVMDASSVQCLSKSNVCPLFVHIGMLSLGKIIGGQNQDKLLIWTMFGQMLDFHVCLSMSNDCPQFVHCQKL